MKDFFQQRWVLVGVLVMFIILKLPHLSYPFYWDESWPYASGVNEMYVHGPSLMPGAISGEVARGHPLMFHFLAACWMNLFGSSHIAMHAYPLFISLLLLIVIYETALAFFDRRTAIVALLTIAVQQCFFVQSAFLLLEIQLALFGFMSILFYAKEKWLPAAISLTLLFYTKESGMVVGVVLGIDALIRLLDKHTTPRQKLYRILSVTIPAVLIGIFFILQKRVSGWYVLPLYTSGFENSWNSFVYKFSILFNIVFIDDYRAVYYLTIVLLAIIAAWKLKRTALALIAIPAALIGCNHYIRGPVADSLLVPASCVSLYYPVVIVFKQSSMNENPVFMRLCKLSMIFIISFLIFSAFNLFVIERYLFIIMIPTLFFSATLLFLFINILDKRLFIPTVAISFCVGIYAYTQNPWHSDMKMDAFNGMYVQKQMVVFLEQHNLYNKTISSHSFLNRMHLEDRYTGFIDGRDTFKNVIWNYEWGPDIIMMDNIEPDPSYDAVKADTFFKLVYRVEKGTAWGEIYGRKQTIDIK